MKTILSVYKNMQDKNASTNTELNLHSMNCSFNMITTLQKKWTILLLLLFSTSFLSVNAQNCGFTAGDGCPNTDYSNFGFYSNNNPATIEYDNMVSAFHATIVRNANGSFSVWGAYMANDGAGDVLSPQEVNSTNYPALGSHKVLKATVSSDGSQQTILLTSDGLYTWGVVGRAFNSTLKPTAAFGRVGNTNGSSTSNLPPAVTPADVKMLTASNLNSTTGGNIILTTCSGEVWALAIAPSVRGDGTSPAIANNLSWSQVKKSAGVPLTNIVAARINRSTVIALDSNNTLWTWGLSALLGNGDPSANLSYATQMTHPDATKTIKMIGATAWGGGGASASPSYYVLMTDGNLYSLGNNTMRQLGDWTSTQRTSWVQPRYTSAAGPVMNNIKWISPQENDETYATINVITNDGQLYAWGDNHTGMLGRNITSSGAFPGQPSGLLSTDKIIAVESGGHTSMIIKECSANFGYVGHRVSGSMGNGSAVNGQADAYTFVTAPVNICGALAVNIIPVGGTENIDGSYCIDAPPTQLTASTPGGTWSIVSGPATITSTGVLTFSGIGTVIVNYVPPVSCNQNTSVYTIEVKSPMSITAAPTAGICANSAITPITLTTGGVATGATATGLPPGLTGTWASNVFTISGTPTTNGTYTYTVAATGPGCDASTTGTLTVITCLVQTNSCGFEAGDGCSNTDYSNFGLYSNNDAATIEYDNFVSAFHSTVVRNSNGSFSLWGQEIANNGISNVLVPQDLSSANYPALGTHKVLKVTIGSNGNNHQAFALTSNGLFTWGVRGLVVATSFTPTPTFARMANTNGTSSNLPPEVEPKDVKMLTASTDASTGGGSLVITTCSGNVWVLGLNAITRGNGSTGTNTEWSQVQTSAGNPLTGIVAARVQGATLIALKNDNTLWTWGKKTYLGNGSAVLNRNFATQMEHPDATKTIKMIGVTGRAALHTSYYVLMTDGNLYALGDNTYKQLGDWTITDRTSWVQPRYTSAAGPVMNDIQWISVNESDSTNPSVNAITKTGQLYAWGESSFGSIGRGTVAAYPGIPNGIAASDKIIAVETGGHTTMVIKECASSFGYVGHRINGSMANGTASDGQENTYTFNTSTVDICGAQAINIIPNGGTQNAGSYCIDGPPTLSASPSGGTWVVASGPATITSTGVLTFTDVGTVIVNYTGPITCNQNTSVYSLTAEYCCPVVSPISN